MSSTYDKLNQVKKRLQEHPTSIQELADYMNCNIRTMYRYITTLEGENCGLKQDKKTHRFFISPDVPKRPESLIRELKSAQKVLDNMGVAHGKSIKKAIKILNGEVSESVEAANHAINVDNDFVVDLGPFSEYSENLQFRETEIDKFLDAIKNRSKLKITYVSAHDNATEEKIDICPVKLVLRVDTLYLVAYVELGEGKMERRLFAVRRIRNFRKTGGFFPEIPFSYKDLYANCFGKYTGKDFPKIKLVMEVKSSWLQTQLREAHFNPPIKIRKQNPMTVELNICDTPDLEGWLLGILPDVKILEPESLKERLRLQLKKSSEALS